MSTFSIRTEIEASTFSKMLNEFRKNNDLGSGGDENYLSDLFQLCAPIDIGDRLFNAIVDLELTYLFMDKDVKQAAGGWNANFSTGKLEGGSVLDNYAKFHGKMQILEGLNSFTFRCRAFWDKYMGILVLINDFDNYQKYCMAKSRKKKFKTLAESWDNFPLEIQKSLVDHLQQTELYSELSLALKNNGIFPNPFLDIFFTLIEQLDNHYRTPEAHGTGSVRKWTLSMLPMEQLQDFGLFNHWNLAINFIQGLRKALLSGQFSHNKSLQPTTNAAID